MAEELGALVIRIQADLAELRKGMSDAERIALAGGKTFEKVASQIAGHMQRIRGVDPRATTELRLMEQAMLRLQQKAPLTTAEIDRLAVSTQRLAARGGEVPKALQAIVATSGQAQAGTAALSAAQNELTSSAMRLAGPMGGVTSILSSLGPYGIAAAIGIGVTAGAAWKIGEALWSAAKAAGTYGSELIKTGRETGMSARGMQELAEAAKLSDIEWGTIVRSTDRLNSALEETPEKFERLGLSAVALSQMSPDEALTKTVEAMQALGTQSERTAAAADIFGIKVGAQMLALETNAGKVSTALGLVWTQKELKAADDFDDQLGQLNRTWEGLWRNIGLGIAESPEIVAGLKQITLALGEMSTWVLGHKEDIGALFHGIAINLQIAAAAMRVLNANLPGGAGAVRTPEVIAGQAGGGINDARARKQAEEALAFAIAKANGLLADQDAAGRAATKAYIDEVEEKTRIEKSGAAEIDAIRKGAMQDYLSEIDEKGRVEKALAEEVKGIAKERAEQLKALEEAFEREYGTAEKGAKAASSESHKLTSSIQDLAAAMELLPGIAGTAFASMLGAMSVASDAGQKLKSALDPGLDKDGKQIKRDYAAGAIAGLQGVAALGQAYQAKTQGQRVAGGAMAGAQAGAAFGPAGAAIGGAIGGLGGLISGDPSWVKAGKDAGRILGHAVSDEAAKAIDARAKDLGIGRSEAVLLDLSSLATEAGKPMGEFAGKTISLFNAIALKAVPAQEGMAELQKQFAKLREEGGFIAHPELIDRMMQAIRDGSLSGAAAVDMMASAFSSLTEGTMAGLAGSRKELLALIAEAKAGGVVISGLKDYVTSTMSGAGADLATIFRGGATGKKDEAGADIYSGGLVSGANAGGMFGANFSAIRDSQGLLAAVSQLKDAWSLMSPEAQGQGNLSGLMALGGAGVSPIVESGVALERNITSLGNAGYMSKDAFGGAQAGALEYRRQLEGAGVGSGAALEAMGPMLAELQASAKDYGLTLSADMLKTLEDAKAAGVVFASDPTEKLTSVMTDIQIPAIEAQTRALEAMTRAIQSGGMSSISGVTPTAGGWNPEEMRKAIMDGMKAVPLKVDSYLDGRQITDSVTSNIAANVGGSGTRVADGLVQQGRI